ncbi:MAG TPA: hypothetical protein VFG44_01410, partial [Burkholderiales bacterium]|nr:hypothetical protein [Burkholderiales bacterium]
MLGWFDCMNVESTKMRSRRYDSRIISMRSRNLNTGGFAPLSPGFPVMKLVAGGMFGLAQRFAPHDESHRAFQRPSLAIHAVASWIRFG